MTWMGGVEAQEEGLRERGDMYLWLNLIIVKAFLVAQLAKNPPAIQETPVQFLGCEDPLEKGWAIQWQSWALWWLN